MAAYTPFPLGAPSHFASGTAPCELSCQSPIIPSLLLSTFLMPGNC